MRSAEHRWPRVSIPRREVSCLNRISQTQCAYILETSLTVESVRSTDRTRILGSLRTHVRSKHTETLLGIGSKRYCRMDGSIFALLWCYLLSKRLKYCGLVIEEENPLISYTPGRICQIRQFHMFRSKTVYIIETAHGATGLNTSTGIL
jgi:hypothetical protein